MKIFGCHGNELPIKEILYQSVFGDKYYMIGHKFTISVTMDVSPIAWCLARAVLNNIKFCFLKNLHALCRRCVGDIFCTVITKRVLRIFTSVSYIFYNRTPKPRATRKAFICLCSSTCAVPLINWYQNIS